MLTFWLLFYCVWYGHIQESSSWQEALDCFVHLQLHIFDLLSALLSVVRCFRWSSKRGLEFWTYLIGVIAYGDNIEEFDVLDIFPDIKTIIWALAETLLLSHSKVGPKLTVSCVWLYSCLQI